MRLFISFLITIGIVGIIAGGFYSIYEINNLKEQSKIDLKEIEDLKYENKRIRHKLAKRENLIRSYQRQQQKYTYNNIKANINKKKYNKKKRKETVKTETRYYEPKKNNTTYTRNNTKHKSNNTKTYTKKYQKFSKHIKLISDSKIIKQNDNRLKSNAPIYGRYYDKQISNINCDNNKNIYQVENECSMMLYFTDKVYLSKSNIDDVKNFNSKTHMIECDYSKKYGLMHDCSVKIYKYKG